MADKFKEDEMGWKYGKCGSAEECMQGFVTTPEESWARRGVVVKALRYKPASRGFDSQWCHWNFSVT